MFLVYHIETYGIQMYVHGVRQLIMKTRIAFSYIYYYANYSDVYNCVLLSVR